MARPRDPAKTEEIIERLAEGEGLDRICADIGVSAAHFRRDVIDDVDGLGSRYARAKNIGLDRMAEELLEIADTPVEGIIEKHGKEGKEITKKDAIEHRRLQIDTRKWYLAKLAPKRYGDKLDITSDGEKLAGDPADVASKAASLVQKALARKPKDEGDFDLSSLV